MMGGLWTLTQRLACAYIEHLDGSTGTSEANFRLQFD
jgi:hypothetical protein